MRVRELAEALPCGCGILAVPPFASCHSGTTALGLLAAAHPRLGYRRDLLSQGDSSRLLHIPGL